jgi:hypothetical protein
VFVPRKELKEMVTGTGWRIAEIISDRGPGYALALKTSTPQPLEFAGFQIARIQVVADTSCYYVRNLVVMSI